MTRSKVRTDFLVSDEVQDAGGRQHREYWIPVEDLPAFKAAITGFIEVVQDLAGPTQGDDCGMKQPFPERPLFYYRPFW